MPRTSTKTLLVAALSALLFAGCGSTPRTQVTLFVDADSVVRGETVSMRVEFFEPGNATAVYVETVPMTNWPVTFALIQDVQDEFVAHVYALDVGGQTVAEGVAWSSFVPRSTRFYYLFLERSPCTSAMIAACDADEVCQNGGTCAQVPFTPGTDLPAPPTEGENPDPCGLVTCGTDALCAVSTRCRPMRSPCTRIVGANSDASLIVISRKRTGVPVGILLARRSCRSLSRYSRESRLSA